MPRAKPDIWMPLYVGDYLADTAHLTTEQHGAYLLLMMHYWKVGPLMDDNANLARITRLSLEAWMMHRPTIRAFFAVADDGLLHQKRVDTEKLKAQAKHEVFTERARKASEAALARKANTSSPRNLEGNLDGTLKVPNTPPGTLKVPQPQPPIRDAGGKTAVTTERVVGSEPASQLVAGPLGTLPTLDRSQAKIPSDNFNLVSPVPAGKVKGNRFGATNHAKNASNNAPGSPESDRNGAGGPQARLIPQTGELVPYDPLGDRILMTFPCHGKQKTWPLHESKALEWHEAYPGLNIGNEMRAAKQWLIDNPRLGKTFTGMPRYINGRLSRAQNDLSKGNHNGNGTHPVRTKSSGNAEVVANVLRRQAAERDRADSPRSDGT